MAITGSAYGYVDDNPLNGTDPMGLSPWGWIKHHAAQVAVGVSVVGAVACAASLACGLAVVGAISAVSATAGTTILTAAAGIGAAGTVASLAGAAPGEDPATSVTSGLNLGRQLASEEQMGGPGTPFAGAGCKDAFRGAADAAASMAATRPTG